MASGDLVVRLRAVTKSFEAGMARSNSALKSLRRSVVAGVSAWGAYRFAANAVSKAVIQMQSEAKLSAVLRTTGGVIGETTESLQKYAASLQRVTNFGDETTISAMGVLSTFKNVGPIFRETVVLAQDLASVMGTSLDSAVMQLGKALNDPVTGLTALRRAGVSFSAAQKKVIKDLVDTNDLLGAQKIILGELDSQVGGTAESMSTSLTRMSGVWGDFVEGIGRSIVGLDKFLGLSSKINAGLRHVTAGSPERWEGREGLELADRGALEEMYTRKAMDRRSISRVVPTSRAPDPLVDWAKMMADYEVEQQRAMLSHVRQLYSGKTPPTIPIGVGEVEMKKRVQDWLDVEQAKKDTGGLPESLVRAIAKDMDYNVAYRGSPLHMEHPGWGAPPVPPGVFKPKSAPITGLKNIFQSLLPEAGGLRDRMFDKESRSKLAGSIAGALSTGKESVLGDMQGVLDNIGFAVRKQVKLGWGAIGEKDAAPGARLLGAAGSRSTEAAKILLAAVGGPQANTEKKKELDFMQRTAKGVGSTVGLLTDLLAEFKRDGGSVELVEAAAVGSE